MAIERLIRVLGVQRVTVVAGMLAGVILALVLAMVVPSTYTAETQLFVSGPAKNQSSVGSYQASLYAQQRALEGAQYLSSPGAAQAVIDRLGLDEDAEELQERIHATVPPNSVLVNVEATAGSPAAAARLADELDAALLKFAERPLGDGEEGLPARVTVTKPARLPDERSSPRTPIYIALGLLLGLAVGIAAALLRDGLDPSARVEDDAVAAASAPVLARIPREDSADGAPASPTDPWGKRAEAYRALRANLRAVSSEHDLRSFVLSSATSGAGTTDVVIGLGIALAQANARVALVDADLRAPKLANRLGIAPGVGLTDLLREGTAASLALRRGPEATLEVIPGGEAVGHPGDLLESDALAEVLDELSRAFDIVLIDTPPLLFASDAASVARRASAAVLVARSGVTATEKLRLAERALRAVGKPALGVVFNDVTERDERIRRKEPVPTRRNRLRTAARAQARRKESGRSLHW